REPVGEVHPAPISICAKLAHLGISPAFFSMPTLDQAIERLYALNVGIVGTDKNRHERPHKPLLLLAAFDLIGQGLATPDAIPWCSGLRELFTERFEIVRTLNDR